MNTEIQTAINVLLKKIDSKHVLESQDALRYTQAVLNLAHAEATLVGAKMLEVSK